MSSDDFVCSWCGEISSVCGYFRNCDNCMSTFCCDECAENAGLTKVDGSEDDNSCCYCRGEAFTDEQILEYALKKLKTTRKKIVKEMKGS